MQGKLSISETAKSGKEKLSIIQNREQKRLIRTPNWTKKTTSGKGSELERAISLLESIPPDLADSYWEWIKVGTALKTVSEALLPEWEQWSRQSSKYKAGECEYKWKFLKPGTVTIGTLYYLANQSR
jgi:hypothetical protein